MVTCVLLLQQKQKYDAAQVACILTAFLLTTCMRRRNKTYQTQFLTSSLEAAAWMRTRTGSSGQNKELLNTDKNDFKSFLPFGPHQLHQYGQELWKGLQ